MKIDAFDNRRSRAPRTRPSPSHNRASRRQDDPLWIEASLCQGEISGVVGARRGWTPGGEGLVVVALVVGSGSDLSEEPVFRMSSRSRWIQSRS